MTELLPYSARKRDVAINNAIVNAELPADLSTIAVPASIQAVLRMCWQQEPELRPTIAWCQETLPSGLRTLLQHPFSEIPGVFKAQGHGWNAVCNPDLDKTYVCEILSIVDDVGTW